ncbi:MAG: MCE family protein [Myxococcales bacterium]|nr:MCE family protein [Myxococcales bacterium]
MASSERGLQLKVGALILVAVLLLGGFIVLLGSVSFSSGQRLRVDFDFSGNLQAGAPVKISGIKVGKVEEVAFFGGKMDEQVGRRVQVRATVWVEDRARESIRQDAEFFVNTAGVLGEQYLEVAPGDFKKPPLDFAIPVRGVDPPRTDLIVSRLYELLDSITSLLRDDKDVIRDFLKSGASMVRTLDGILKENHEEIARLLKNVDKLTAEASGLIGSFRTGVGDGAQLKRTLENIEALSGSIRKDIDPLISKAKKALDGVENITSVIGPEEKKKLVRALDELITVGEKVKGVTTDAQAIVADVKKGKGTAGALLVDPQIYDDLKELVRDLKRNPWKFFWKE